MMAQRNHIPKHSTFGAIFFGLSLSVLTGAAVGTNDRSGFEVFSRSTYEKARPHFAELARAGDPRAQYGLGKTIGEAHESSRDLAEATYRLGCAGNSDQRMAMNARRSKPTQWKWS